MKIITDNGKTLSSMEIVTDGRTLRALQRAKKINEPELTFRPKGKTWGRGYSYVNGLMDNFSHNNINYKLTYISGTFFPYVEKL